MSFKIFITSIIIGAGLALVAATSASAHESSDCNVSKACSVLNAGQERRRTPVWCVSIPFQKKLKGRSKTAMFVLQRFDPDIDLDSQLAEPGNLIFTDSKIAGWQDDFCRNPRYFMGAGAVVLCDKKSGTGWIQGDSLAYAINNGRPPNNQRVHLGRF